MIQQTKPNTSVSIFIESCLLSNKKPWNEIIQSLYQLGKASGTEEVSLPVTFFQISL